MLLEQEHYTDQVKDDECTFTETDPNFTMPWAWTVEKSIVALATRQIFTQVSLRRTEFIALV